MSEVLIGDDLFNQNREVDVAESYDLIIREIANYLHGCGGISKVNRIASNNIKPGGDTRAQELLLHSCNTKQWVQTLLKDHNRKCGEDMVVASLASCIGDADSKALNCYDFQDYYSYRIAVHKRSAEIIRDIMSRSGALDGMINRVCFLIENHELGDSSNHDIELNALRDADAVSYYDVLLVCDCSHVNDIRDLRGRCKWELKRMSSEARLKLKSFHYPNNKSANELLKDMMESPVA